MMPRTQVRRAPWRATLVAAAVIALIVSAVPLARQARAAAPATYYVAPGGSDRNPGTQAQPFGTLTTALKRLAPGDTLVLRGGTYAERVMNPKVRAGTSDAPVRVQNAPGERPVVQGLFWLSGADYWQFSGVNVTWGAGDSSDEHMVKLSGGTGWSFTNAEVWGAHSYAGLMVTGGARGWTLSGLYVHDTYTSNDVNQDHLVYVSQGFDGVIEHNLFVNSPNGRGVKLARPTAGDGAPAGIVVRYNTFVNNQGANVSTSYDAHDNQVYGNLMVNSGGGAKQNVTALSLTGGNTVVKNNVGWQAAAIVEQGAGLVDGGGNRMLDPRLDANFKPTNPALLDAGGKPLVGQLAGDAASAPQPTATPTPTPAPQPSPSATPSPSPSPAPSVTPSPSPSPAPAQTTGTLINDSFNTVATGQLPSGWFDAHNGLSGTLGVAAVPSAAQKSLRASETQATGDVRPSKLFAPVAGGWVTAQADVLISAQPKNSAVYVASLMSGAEFASAVSLGKNGHFMYFDGATPVDTGVAYRANTWYRVMVTLNVAKRTYNVQIQAVGSTRALVSVVGKAWRSSTATSVDRIRFDTSDGDMGLNLYIDNVRVASR